MPCASGGVHLVKGPAHVGAVADDAHEDRREDDRTERDGAREHVRLVGQVHPAVHALRHSAVGVTTPQQREKCCWQAAVGRTGQIAQKPSTNSASVKAMYT